MPLALNAEEQQPVGFARLWKGTRRVPISRCHWSSVKQCYHLQLTHLSGSGREGVRSRMEADLPLLLGRKKEELQGNEKVEIHSAEESINKVLHL